MFFDKVNEEIAAYVYYALLIDALGRSWYRLKTLLFQY